MKRYILTTLLCCCIILQGCQAPAASINTPVGTSEPSVANETPMAPGTEQSAPVASFEPVSLKAGYGFRSSWLDMYFTDPASIYAPEEVGGVDGILSAAIISANESVDVALSSLSLPVLTNALIRAHDRGTKIRIVMESDYLDDVDRPNPKALIDDGIPVIGDREKGNMSNNFVVIDNRQVWTGSMNFTATGVYHGYDYLINIESEELAQNYLREFEEMFTTSQFGPNVVPDTPHPTLDVKGTQIESLFLPDDLFAARLTELFNNAKESIVFSSFTFTSEDFGDLLRKRASEGVKVTGVIDDFELDLAQVSQYELFKTAGLDVHLGSPDIVLFSNFIVIDDEIVVLGTYDFSRKAELTSDGNILIIHNADVAAKFLAEFQKIQSTAQK